MAEEQYNIPQIPGYGFNDGRKDYSSVKYSGCNSCCGCEFYKR
jgi:hypothetical protein